MCNLFLKPLSKPFTPVARTGRQSIGRLCRLVRAASPIGEGTAVGTPATQWLRHWEEPLRWAALPT
ncbi:MAG: hypothetical protein ACYTX0_24765 [Nostoc sp.]